MKRAQFYRDIGRQIRDRRILVEMSQEKLAKKIGLTRTSIVNIEGGNQRMLLHTYFDIMRATEESKP